MANDSSFGKYALIAELGRGGMADVFLAVQAGPVGSGFRKLIVVKRLRQNLADDPQFVRMLVDEARIAARLNHPNVVQTYEVGQVDNQHFIAMEYLDGQPLHRIQHRAAKADALIKSLQYIVLMDVAAGLHHAHTLKDFDGTKIAIVHRDVTPQNIFVTYEGSVKIVDFGIAKAAGRTQETAHGVVKGKIRYMAPEQALGLALDARTDIFSLGVMLWEAATGERMWNDAEDIRIVTALATGEIPSSPRDVDPNVPEALDAICRKALATNREERYASAEEFRLALEHYLAESGQLLSARRALGPKVSELFKDKREEIERVIERRLAKLGAAGGSVPPPEVLPLVTSSGSISSAHGQGSSISNAVASDSTGGSSPRRMGLALALGGVALLVLGGLAWKKTHPEAPARVEPVSAAPLTPTSASAPAAASAEITLHFTSIPADARVSIDDGPPVAMPLTKQVTRDDRTHRLTIEAEGYEPRETVARFTTDQTMNFELTRATVAPTSAGKPPLHGSVGRNTRTSAQVPAQVPTGAAPPATTTATTPPPPPPEGPRNRNKPTESLDRDDPWGAKK